MAASVSGGRTVPGSKKMTILGLLRLFAVVGMVKVKANWVGEMTIGLVCTGSVGMMAPKGADADICRYVSRSLRYFTKSLLGRDMMCL